MGRADVRAPAVGMAFTHDGSLLVAATSEWNLVGVSATTFRAKVIAPYRGPARDKPLDHILLAITKGSKPAIFFTRAGKDSVRMTYTTGFTVAEKKSANDVKWGVKLVLDVRKPIANLAAAAHESQLLVLFQVQWCLLLRVFGGWVFVCFLECVCLIDTQQQTNN